ncbi:uncharacterized protein P884DRAFT_279028 [Thermothelomyces heterothallicus CBS 202.75]|uniref:uncharacterized protein n=1 Tax=Thermothelomyces heterothallicus CBS 202.75 TaxID=1149848 RepID=UPI0037423BDB
MDESGQKGTGTSVQSVQSEAAFFSVVKPSRSTADSLPSPATDSLTGRPSSMKTGPVGRKTSFRVREWAKRSNSSRTAPSTGTSASESLKSHIKHLGGGRLEQVEVRGTANNTTLLAPFPKRGLRSRTGSIDSRVTQWVDFYPSSSESSNSQSKPQAAAAAADDDEEEEEEEEEDGKRPDNEQPGQQQRQQERQQERQRERAGSNSDLRPAPLRIPSSERRGGASADTAPSKPLERKDSKWKPLPTLPAQRASSGREQFGLGPAPPTPTKRAERQGRQEPEPAEQPPTEQGKGGPSRSDEPQPLPTFRFDSAPPTPDSSAGGAARALVGLEQDWGRQDEGARARPAGELRGPKGPLQDRAPGGRDEKSTGRSGAGGVDSPPKQVLRHTREERVWLHVNYRGEAPFLQAWGLDIANPGDRLEGLTILRELMQAEGAGGGPERREHGNAA